MRDERDKGEIQAIPSSAYLGLARRAFLACLAFRAPGPVALDAR